MFELKVVTHFAAAHQLEMVGEKCENLHGHNWKVEVYVAGENLNNAGVLMDFGEIKKSVAEIMTRLDHKFLNEVEPFHDGYQPSSENIASTIYTELQALLREANVSISSIQVYESPQSCITYFPEEG